MRGHFPGYGVPFTCDLPGFAGNLRAEYTAHRVVRPVNGLFHRTNLVGMGDEE
jgi:hypothetical protein